MVLRPKVQIVDVVPGLWLWRVAHPHWSEDVDWQQAVTSVCADVGQERWVIDPLLPSREATAFWDRFAERSPTAVAVLLPDHMRETCDDPETWSVDALVGRYGCRAFGPNAFDPDMGEAETNVHRIEPGQELPGGVVPFSDPRGWNETPLWLPEHRTLVVGDTLTERDGVLRVWTSPTHEERALPTLRSMLDLPFERVIISHGEPVHARDAFERALQRPPWPASSLHLAAWHGNLEQVRKLVEHGAEVSALAENIAGTPLDWARNAAGSNAAKPSHHDVIAYLESMTTTREA